MSRKVTKRQIAQIIKRQPRVVLKRIDISKDENLGLEVVQRKAVKNAVRERSTRKRKKPTLFNQVPPNSTQKPVKTIAVRNTREIIRTTKVFSKNNIVLVQWTHFPNWPAIIQSIKGNSIYVQFFGDGRLIAKVNATRCALFEENTEYVTRTLQMKRWFHKYSVAVREVEIVMGIVDQQSIVHLI